MHYKKLVITRNESSPSPELIEQDLRAPATNEVRIKVLAAGVCDAAVPRPGRLAPGHTILGVVDAVGAGVHLVDLDERVAAWPAFGGYAEYVYLDELQLVPVPASLPPAETMALMVYYLAACQMMHRVARLKAGDRVLIIDGGSGVETALLQLGRLANLTMYAAASPDRHPVLTEHGAIAIDCTGENLVNVMRQIEPAGLDAVFDGLGDEYLRRGVALLRRGGILVHYSTPHNWRHLLRRMAQSVWSNVLPDGKSVKGYEIDLESLAADWGRLFELMEEGHVAPVVGETLSILEAAKAGRLLEAGQAGSHIVLMAPELL